MNIFIRRVIPPDIFAPIIRWFEPHGRIFCRTAVRLLRTYVFRKNVLRKTTSSVRNKLFTKKYAFCWTFSENWYITYRYMFFDRIGKEPSIKQTVKNIFIVGFAFFSMLFGAGNLIFPPYLGLSCGAQWLHGFFYYYIADIGLALGCLFAIQRCGGHRVITGHLGRIPSEILICVFVLCIGPMLGIPRTAASTFEMSVLPLFPEANPFFFSFLFFALVAVLSMKEARVVDIIGKLLSPFLMIGLFILIIKGFIHPIGVAGGEVLVNNISATGINAGYQTMDVLAVVIFGIIISKSVQEKGYYQRSSQNRVVFGAEIVAGISLLVMYLGLTFLGATASDRYDLSVNHTLLVTSIVHLLLGQTGTVIFAMVVALACLTTAVALVSSTSDYFSNLAGNRIRYSCLVVLICGFPL